MQRFASARDAKEYLINRIVAQSSQDGVSLTDIERKMLYFSETHWTLPDMMQVNSEFDQNYENDQYERKIAGLVRRIREAGEDRKSWDEAVRRLRSEDHYLLVLIDGDSQLPASRPPGDILRLILTGCAISAVLLLVMFVVGPHVSDKQVSKALFTSVFIVLIAGAMYLNRRTSR
jgi:hypothetical protein